MAWVCNSRHDFEAGGRWARQTLEVVPKTAEAFALLGDAAVEYGDYDAAFEYYQDCLDLAPNLSSYSRAAQLLWLTGDVSRAKNLMRKAIAAGSSRPEDTAWCRAELARMCLNTGSVTVAEREAEIALQSAPNLPHALVVMGGVKSALRDYPAAIGLYRRAVEIAPTHDALVALGDLYALAGQDGEAAKTYVRVVALHKSDSQEHSHDGVRHQHIPARGNAQLARFLADHDRDLDEALAAADAAFRSFTNVFVADALAWCYYKKGEFDKAHQTILKALRWNTPDATIHFHAGMIAAKLGDHGFARMQLYRALNLNPHFHPKDAPLAAETLKALAAAATTARAK
jgi:tetratricopeptide (TPR) repeat protein